MARRAVLVPAMLAALLCIFSQVSVQSAFADPLFETDAPVSLRLEGPFREIRAARDKRASYPATLTHDGKVYNVSLGVRGNWRLNRDVCRNPPLWLDFDKAESRDTLFDKQKHIKLVVLCKPRRKYEDYLRGEFLIYQMLNRLTEDSFLVRWVSITYVENGRERVEPAFFIERKARLARRRDYAKNERPRVAVSELSIQEASLASLFQYVIANPDFSFLSGSDPEDDCCHNAKLLGTPDKSYVPVPYDFDSSGIINAEYTVPNEAIGVKRVTQRIYRGYCATNPAMEAARARLLENRAMLVDLLLTDEILGGKKARRMSAFLETSFNVLADDAAFRREIIGECRG